jgi:hypothetical protein
MLQTKPLQELLTQALSPSVHTAVVVTQQGTLIALAPNEGSNSFESENARRHARSIGAMATVIWRSYSGVQGIDELWDTPNGDSNGDVQAPPKNGLIWTAVECDVCSHLSPSDDRIANCSYTKRRR